MATTEQAVQQVGTIRENQIKDSLERLGKALSRGDLEGISSSWEVPALVLFDGGAQAVSSLGEVEKFFAQAVQWYQERGLVATRPEIERVEVLSEKLASVDVRWPAFDKAGTEKASERSHYIVQLGDDGRPRIRVALTKTAEP